MFEMLGNWSYGDYFKREAIEWAWELLTEVYKLPAERMYATVFEGSEEDGVPFDSEAYDVWRGSCRRITSSAATSTTISGRWARRVPAAPVRRFISTCATRRRSLLVRGAKMVNTGHPQVIEIWNLVFMQFNRKANGTLEPLPAKNVDTGMGFERLCMIMQGKKSNYDTDVFQPTIGRLAALSGKLRGGRQVHVAMRVVADHLPRHRLLDRRRPAAVECREGRGMSSAASATPCATATPIWVSPSHSSASWWRGWWRRWATSSPELRAQQTLIERVIEEEEEFVPADAGHGYHTARRRDRRGQETGRIKISGHDAFVLYDTYGFPIDLTG